MFQKEFEVLVVDDDPDVLAVTKLAMRGIKVYGIHLKVRTCASLAEAIELFNTKADLLPALAVALIDVVMETDTAGLDLCRYVREERKNQLTQLFIRTGQPGTAPERSVIDRYDVNGYFTKAEATEDKIYSMVKSGIRQFYWSFFAVGVLGEMRRVAAAVGSRARIASIIQDHYDRAFLERTGEPVGSYTNVNVACIFGDEVAASYGWNQEAALEARDRLDKLEGVPIGEPGDKYVIDENNQLLVKVCARPGIAAACLVSTPTFRVPDFVPEVVYYSICSHAANWNSSS